MTEDGIEVKEAQARLEYNAKHWGGVGGGGSTGGKKTGAE